MPVKNTAEYQPKADPSLLRGERFDGWGYSDTNFTLENGVISLGGSRYEISGKRMPALLSWASGILGVDLKLQDDYTPKGLTPIPAARDLPELISALENAGVSYTQDDLARRRHGHGHALEEVYAIKLGRLHRAPDMVTYPESEEQVIQLVALAAQHNVVLVPFGGGTNVSHALQCPENETRAIVSVDLRRMNKILELSGRTFRRNSRNWVTPSVTNLTASNFPRLAVGLPPARAA
jgi:alkyldihydroxyacetonephosphate synthase